MAAARATKIPQTNKIEQVSLEEQIRRRAHEIYLQRGGQEGLELDDWLQAEAEMLVEQGKEA